MMILCHIGSEMYSTPQYIMTHSGAMNCFFLDHVIYKICLIFRPAYLATFHRPNLRENTLKRTIKPQLMYGLHSVAVILKGSQLAKV